MRTGARCRRPLAPLTILPENCGRTTPTMQGLARISVMRPVFATVLVLALAVVGLFAIPRLGVDRFPSVDFPWVTVVTTLPGATPAEMETEVTEEIERQVNTVSGIEQITST